MRNPGSFQLQDVTFYHVNLYCRRRCLRCYPTHAKSSRDADIYLSHIRGGGQHDRTLFDSACDCGPELPIPHGLILRRSVDKRMRHTVEDVIKPIAPLIVSAIAKSLFP